MRPFARAEKMPDLLLPLCKRDANDRQTIGTLSGWDDTVGAALSLTKLPGD
jgi:hypothetical protein